ncbi:MAG TPA: septal ring lytic transglycosylase RlpA family protein [Caldimonas sp.]|jgi:rare lipoprotein A|nr:septal ring lytic transglycosylase RlpA family protein [Caldimonas sp.]HEX2543111.1 septal ring lytic transglycosylase RlpA family protein [Caldimonas sp.]
MRTTLAPPTPRCTWALACAIVLAGCAGTKVSERQHRPGASAAVTDDRDGPGLDPPADLASRPDAEPRIDTVRPGGANKPYQILGRDYVPVTGDLPFLERGLASWYGRKFHGRPTAIGETYDMYAMTAAHPTLPLPSYARIRNPANGREVIVRVNDRGPFHAGRIVDLSYAAAARLGLLRAIAPVELERITHADIRAGTWRRPGEEPTRLAAVVPSADAAAPALAPIAASPAEAAEAHRATGRGFWLQLGAFRERGGAESLRRSLGGEAEALLPNLTTFADAAVYRVQAGPYASRDQAGEAAQRVREALGLVPLVVERR